MPRSYFRALCRVALLSTLVTTLMVLFPSRKALADTCSQCLADCQPQYQQCLADCEAQGLAGCEQACNGGETCLQSCADLGLCP